MKQRKSSQDRSAEILAATLDLAFEVGPDHVTTGMIAERLGLTQPAIYKHFPKKEDVWVEAAETLHQRILRNIEMRHVDGQSAMDRLRRLVVSHFDLVTETPALPEIMVARDPTGTLTQARRRIQAAMSAFRAAIARELQQAQNDGNLHAGLRIEDGTTLLFGVIQSLVLRLIITRDATQLAQEGERLVDLQLLLFKSEGEGL